MSKFPVESNDTDGITDAVNYLLSGPAGLGQDFAGFSSSSPGWLTGNYRTPFTNPNPINLAIAPIPLGVSEMLDERTWKFTFATPQSSPPFLNGNILEVVGVADSFYDGAYSPIGVVSCTTTYVIARLTASYALRAPSSGGTAALNAMNQWNSTDCNARVTVAGASDRVFISGQLNSILSYVGRTTGSLYHYVAINRYKGVLNDDPINPDYVFILDETVAERIYPDAFLAPTVGAVQTLTVTGGTNHVPRNTYSRPYSVIPQNSMGGTGSLLVIDIDLIPNVSTSTTGLSSGGPYFGPGIAIPYRDAPFNYKTPTDVSATGTEVVVTVTNTGPAFVVGQSMRVIGASPYNGTYKITSASATELRGDSTAPAGTAFLDSAQIFNPFFNTVITIVSGGEAYQTGDILTISGDQIGGVEGINDMELTVGSVSSAFPVATAETDTVFASVIDNPAPGYYWYILEVKYENLGGDFAVTSDAFSYRGLSAQVVKQ